jgi:hypothetical protein
MPPYAEYRDVPIRQRCAKIEDRHRYYQDHRMEEPAVTTPLFEPQIGHP